MSNLWIIAICDSSKDKPELRRFNGTEKEVKEFLLRYTIEYANENRGCDFKTECIEDIETLEDGSLHAYVVFRDYDIDCYAYEVSCMGFAV